MEYEVIKPEELKEFYSVMENEPILAKVFGLEWLRKKFKVGISVAEIHPLFGYVRHSKEFIEMLKLMVEKKVNNWPTLIKRLRGAKTRSLFKSYYALLKLGAYLLQHGEQIEIEKNYKRKSILAPVDLILKRKPHDVFIEVRLIDEQQIVQDFERATHLPSLRIDHYIEKLYPDFKYAIFPGYTELLTERECNKLGDFLIGIIAKSQKIGKVPRVSIFRDAGKELAKVRFYKTKHRGCVAGSFGPGRSIDNKIKIRQAILHKFNAPQFPDEARMKGFIFLCNTPLGLHEFQEVMSGSTTLMFELGTRKASWGRKPDGILADPKNRDIQDFLQNEVIFVSGLDLNDFTKRHLYLNDKILTLEQLEYIRSLFGKSDK